MGSSKREADSSSDVAEKKRKKKHKKDKKRKKHKKSRDESTSSNSSVEERKKKKKHKKKIKETKNSDVDVMVGPAPPPDLPSSSTEQKSLAPMTKEEWEKKQSVIRRVYDEESGRYRLIKGDGEVIEEIVSRDRHLEINKRATQGDGEYFQSVLKKKI